MIKNENKKELIKLIIVYAIVLGLMLGMAFVSSLIGEKIPMIALYIILYALLMLPVIVYAKMTGTLTAADFGFKKIKVSTFFFTVLLTIVSMPMYMFANVLSQLFVPNTIVQSMDTLFTTNAGSSLFMAVILAPLCEEFICRGFFQNRLKKVVPFFASAVISGLMFGMLHLNLNQFCYALVLGVVFAYANRASGSIFTSMLMHFLINSGNMLFLLVMQAAYASMNTSIGEAAETYRADKSAMLASVIFYGVLAVASFFLTRLVIRAIAKREGNLEVEAWADEIQTQLEK